MQFISIWPIDRTLSGATTVDQSEPGSDSNEGVLCFTQCFSITGPSPSDCLVSYSGHSLMVGVILPLYRGTVDWANRGVRTPTKSILNTKLNLVVKLWVGGVEYPNNVITPRSTFTWRGSTCFICIMVSFPPEVWKTRQFDDILLRHCNAVYNQNPIDRWMKGCILPFPKKGDLGLAKNTYIHSSQNLQCPTTKPHRTQNRQHT